MNKSSSKTHGIIDFATSGAMMLLPRLLGQSKSCRRVLDSMALITLGQSLCTNYEYGLAKYLPFKMHLLLDKLGGAGLLGCAYFNDQLDDDEKATIASFGVMELGTAMMTQPFSETEMNDRIPLRDLTTGEVVKEKLQVLSGMLL